MRSPTSCDSDLPLLAHRLQHQQPRDHAAVAVGEVAEIVVRAHLAAIRAVHLAHLLLDERMAGLAQHRLAAVLAHDVDACSR